MNNLAVKATDGTSRFQRIAFIILYFGKVPWYFNFFNKSCSYNLDVDFILITDLNVTENLANNITLVRSSIDEISKRFTETLGFEVNIVHPYKLCDLRPAYGLVFSDLIEGYDFWGYCDIDLVFGNIRAFITSDILNRHEVVTIKKEYISGPFSLFKNNEKINNIFKKSKDYQRVFQEPLHYDFDECNWEWEPLQEGKDIFQLNSEVASITHVIKEAERAGDIVAYWQSLELLPGDLVWDRGELFHKIDGRAMLCHFVFFKDIDFNYVPRWKSIPERFYLNSFYISRHAPGSLAGWLLHQILLTARSVKRASNLLKQYTRWSISYLVASRKIDVKDSRYADELTGHYRLNNNILVINISIINQRLHMGIHDSQIPLLHRGESKFVLAKCKFLHWVNIELDFLFNEHNSANKLEVTLAGIWKQTFFKIS